MKYLIDTNVYIWAISDYSKISEKALSILKNKDRKLILSVASIWEIIIKKSIGKLSIPTNFSFFSESSKKLKLQILSLEITHLLNIIDLPIFHKDPFDRVLISIAKDLKIPIITNDKLFNKYDIETVW